MQECLKCKNEATWIRHTQFAGSHPFCKEHAKKEEDFGECDSYTCWTKNSH